MKMRLLLAVAGLAIGFALPTFAQQTNTPDPKLREQIIALLEKFNNAWNNNDPVALADLLAEIRSSLPVTINTTEVTPQTTSR